MAPPSLIPVCYALDGDTIYSVIDEKPKRAGPNDLRRIRNIKSNPKVALLIDRYHEDWTRLWYVLLRGVASMLIRGPEYRWALALLREKYPQYARMDLDDKPVIRIRIYRASDWGKLPP